jgi:hypothetical protein
MMTHFFRTALIVAIALIALPHSVNAQDPAKQKQELPVAPDNVLGSLFGDSMHAQLTAMATKVMDGYLDYLAKPETAKKLATFQKNYYDALVAQGFTKEQAFELVLRFGNPLADGPRVGK